MTEPRMWTTEEEQYLKDNYLTMSYKDMATNLNRTKGAVTAKCLKMNLNKVRDLRKIREDYIRKHYATKPTEEIAAHLNIRETSIRKIASQLKVTKRRDIFNERMIYALYKGEELITDGNVYEIAEFLGTDVANVKFYYTPSNRKRNVGGNRRELVFLYDEEEEE